MRFSPVLFSRLWRYILKSSLTPALVFKIEFGYIHRIWMVFNILDIVDSCDIYLYLNRIEESNDGFLNNGIAYHK